MICVDTFVYTAGVTISPTLPITNRGLITKFTLDGEKVWERRYGDSLLTTEPGGTSKKCIIPTLDGNFAFAGFNRNGTASINAFLSKCNSLNGDTLFYRTYDSDIPNTLLMAKSLIQYDDGSFLLACVEDFVDVVLIKTDQLGNEVWRRRYGSSQVKESPARIVRSEGNNVIVYAVASEGSCDDDTDYIKQHWVFEIDFVGDINWEYESPEDRYLGTASITYTANGELLVYGTETIREWLGSPLNYDCPHQGYIAKLNSNNEVEWEQTLGNSNLTTIWSAKELPNGNIIAVGDNRIEYLPDSAQYTGWILQFSAVGELLWERNLTRLYPWIGKWHHLYDLKVMEDGGFLISGTVEDFYIPSPTAGQWGWLVRTDSLGCVSSGCDSNTTSINSPIPEIGNLEISPNPAKPWGWSCARCWIPPGSSRRGSSSSGPRRSA
ncbi:MAG: hypothetical protein AAF502_25210, partial [Bacteroidota bacterium]